MKELVKLNPEQHKFVIGIDFGHGETSAAMCPIQWEVAAGESTMPRQDIRINPANTGNENVIVSAISQVNDQKPQIGENAFNSEQMVDGAKLRVCFKEPPKDLNGEKEQLMIQFMCAIYSKIRDIYVDELTDTNHIVYIARPSGWTQPDTKNLYCQMALEAGIPLAGLTSESRAAIFYARNSPQISFKNDIQKGAIVADLGSSTLDLTYLSTDNKPVDYGYNVGASIVDRIIFEDQILPNEGVQRLLANHPQYENALLYRARTIKEDAYKKSSTNSEIDMSFMLRNVISRDCPDFGSLKNVFVIVEYESLAQLNKVIEERRHYITSIKDALEDFRKKHIPGRTVSGVFLTGGASRMNFVRDLVSEAYKLDPDRVKADPENPSLTISRGIAMLGRADALSFNLQQKLIAATDNIDYSTYQKTFLNKLADALVSEIWPVISAKATEFKNSSLDLCLQDLISNIVAEVNGNMVEGAAKTALKATIGEKTNALRDQLNQIIDIYAPGSEISEVDVDEIDVEIEHIDELNETLKSVVVDIVNDIPDILAFALFFIFAYFILIGTIFYWIYELLKTLWQSPEEAKVEETIQKAKAEQKRREELQKPRSKRDREKLYKGINKDSADIKSKLKKSILDALDPKTDLGKQLASSVDPLFKSYTRAFIDKNVDAVRIPIE